VGEGEGGGHLIGRGLALGDECAGKLGNRHAIGTQQGTNLRCRTLKASPAQRSHKHIDFRPSPVNFQNIPTRRRQPTIIHISATRFLVHLYLDGSKHARTAATRRRLDTSSINRGCLRLYASAIQQQEPQRRSRVQHCRPRARQDRGSPKTRIGDARTTNTLISIGSRDASTANIRS
jgi:hypothetical protein